MAKVKITGHASGTGILTVTAPNTSTNRTITLPDATGTLALTTGDDDKLPLAGGTMTGDLLITRTVPKFTLTDSDDDSYTRMYHSAGKLFIDVDHGEDVADSYFRISVDDSEKLKITSDGRGLSQFTAKAWVNYDQKDTAAVRDSHNVNSVTDSGVGQHQVNFSNAMANANYAVMCTVNASGSGAKGFVMNEQNNNTTGLARNITYIDGTMTDLDTTHTIVFGD